MIAAMANNRVIGVNNGMPWRLPAEMAHFRRSTLGRTVLMGRKTFESLGGKPLKDRRNIVLTREADRVFEGCETVAAVDEAIRRYGNGEELVVIGGAEVYKLFLPYADKLLLTAVDAMVEGDAFVPSFDPVEWQLASSEAHKKDEKNAYDFYIRTYVRKP